MRPSGGAGVVPASISSGCFERNASSTGFVKRVGAQRCGGAAIGEAFELERRGGVVRVDRAAIAELGGGGLDKAVDDRRAIERRRERRGGVGDKARAGIGETFDFGRVPRPVEHLVAIIEDRHRLHEEVAQRRASRRAYVVDGAETLGAAQGFAPELVDLRNFGFIETCLALGARRTADDDVGNGPRRVGLPENVARPGDDRANGAKALFAGRKRRLRFGKRFHLCRSSQAVPFRLSMARKLPEARRVFYEEGHWLLAIGVKRQAMITFDAAARKESTW